MYQYCPNFMLNILRSTFLRICEFSKLYQHLSNLKCQRFCRKCGNSRNIIPAKNSFLDHTRKKFPAKKSFFDTRENKFLHFLFTFLFFATDDYNTLQQNIKQSLIENNKWLDQSFSLLSVFAFNPFCAISRRLQVEIPIVSMSPPYFIFTSSQTNVSCFLKIIIFHDKNQTAMR